MKTYEIIITPDAEEDLRNLRDYIAETLEAPTTARTFLQRMRGEIQTLGELRERSRLMDEEPWHSRGGTREPRVCSECDLRETGPAESAQIIRSFHSVIVRSSGA